MNRKVIQSVKGRPAVDGAGVHMTRVLARRNTEDFDPFLMLDSFDSHDPKDYMAGFPFHPHRGIETLTYLVKGEMDHRDSMGNRGRIRSGEAQWMTAGSGIMHEEMPRESEHLLGFQLWINLPSEDKMCRPHYQALTAEEIALIREEDREIRVLSGEYAGKKGFGPLYVQARILDVLLQKEGTSFTLETEPQNNLFLFTLIGGIRTEGVTYDEKTAILLGEGEKLEITADTDGSRVIIFEAPKLAEPISWGGPIVMNTDEELQLAFDELRNGTFIKDDIR